MSMKPLFTIIAGNHLHRFRHSAYTVEFLGIYFIDLELVVSQYLCWNYCLLFRRGNLDL